jgi:hypothetical protein
MMPGPARAPAYAAWLRRAGRLIAANQRLLVFPAGVALANALAVLPLVAATRPAVTLAVFARDAVDPASRVIDVASANPSRAALAAIAALVVASVVCSAWFTGAFVTSLRDGSVRVWPGLRVFLRLTGFYLVSNAYFYGLVALSQHPAAAGWAFPAALVAAPLTFYADYAIVLEDRGLVSAVVRSVRVTLRRLGPSLTVFAASLAAEAAQRAAFIDPVKNAGRLFPPFILAVFLLNALLQYLTDCALIAVLMGERQR